MTRHSEIMTEIERQYHGMADVITVHPAALAFRVFEAFASGTESPCVEYTSLEHLKHMVRRYLGAKKHPDSDESEAYSQGELDLPVHFSGQLQDRYPIPRKRGEEPAYKRRSDLTPDEVAYNVAMLRKSAKARGEHADALEAELQMRAA